MTKSSLPLVDAARFLLATRESGYHSTAKAIAELVDNSLQASARTIDVIIHRDAAENDHFDIAVVDDGDGIAARDLCRALQFGGSTRFNDRGGLGRFGMGLPNASVSQARRVDVFAWQRLNDPIHTFLDTDLVANGRSDGIPAAGRGSLPEWLTEFAPKRGTAVMWSRCDRVQYRRKSTLETSLHEELGRIFRNALADGRVLRINGRCVQLIDPLRAIPCPTDALVELLPTAGFDIRMGDGRKPTSRVTVTFSCLPIEAWSSLSVEEKRRFRISGWAGVSVLRARREIAYGWHFMGSKKRENYDDWWRCEVSFEPELDELFGVTNSKQSIRPSPALLDAIVPTVESQARSLTRQVRRRFEALRSPASHAIIRAETRHARLPFGSGAADGNDGPSSQASRSIRGVRYRLLSEETGAAAFFRVVRRKSLVSIYLNELHPFYTEVYAPLCAEGNNNARITMDCLLLSLARAAATPQRLADTAVVERFIQRWSDSAAVLLETR